jgi:hypothetical protein
MTQVYKFDIKAWATAYITADSLEEAQTKANDIEELGITCTPELRYAGVELCDVAEVEGDPDFIEIEDE